MNTGRSHFACRPASPMIAFSMNLFIGSRVLRPDMMASTSRPCAMRLPCGVCAANSASVCNWL